MKCSNCGLPISKEEKVCSHCGKRRKGSARLFVITSLSLILLMGVILAAFWFKDEIPGISKQTAKQDPVSVIDKDKDKENNKEKDKDEKNLDKDEKSKQDKKKNNNKKNPDQNEKSKQDKKKEKDSAVDDSKKQKDSDQKKKNKADSKMKNDKDKKTDKTKESNKEKPKTDYIVGENAVAKDEPKIEKQDINTEEKKDLSKYINEAEKSVFTISTPEMQGSGFLYDWNGAIVTNAHVVEGWTEATVRTNEGKEYTGKVIGYSNKTDVAVIHVPELKGKNPFAVNPTGSFNIGEEIVALGSPNGQQNSATMGFITGIDRSFVIGSFLYDHLYQISAPIGAGSSGGPLISKNSKEIIAINSAQSTTDLSIGFSIPLNQVSHLIQSWIDKPMTDSDLLKQFYGEDGKFVIGEEWDQEEGYFEEGDISEEEDHYHYKEYDENQENTNETDEKENTEEDSNKPTDENVEQDDPSKEMETPSTEESKTNKDKEEKDTPSESVPNEQPTEEQPEEVDTPA